MEWAIAAAALAYLVFGVRVVSDAERIAVHRLGRFVGLLGPGLRFRMPGGADVWSRLRLGTRGVAMSPELGVFGEAQVPIESSEPLQQGQLVRIQGFSEAAVRVALDPDQRRTLRCERCGHENAIP